MNHRAAALQGEEGKTHQTQYQIYSTSCEILPVPLYNNTSIIITVAKTKRKRKKWMDRKQKDVTNTQPNQKKKGGRNR